MSRLRVVENDADIARALKANLSQSVLVEGLDLASATHAALVITAGDNAINTVTSPSIEQAQAMLNTLLGGHIGNKKVTLYLGMYRQSREQVDIMSIVGGLKFPVNRLL
jgi:diphthamide biosynthesis methyltransferase